MTSNVDPAAAPNAATATFRRLAADDWTWRLREFPRLATAAGVHDHDDRLERMDAASREARCRHAVDMLAAMAALDVAALDETDRINHAVLVHQLQIQRDEAELGGELMPIDADQSFYAYLGELWRDQPLDTAEAVQRLLDRLASIPAYFDDHIELLREALRRGVMPPAVVLRGREAALVPVAQAARAEDTVFHRVLAGPGGPLQRHPQLAAEAARVIEAEVQPAYRQLLAFLRDEYLPRGRSDLGACTLPQGEAFYAARLRGYTTLPIDARQVHETGLAEVERIGDELRRLQRECGHHGTLAEFLAALRADPKNYPRSGDELLAQASRIAKRVDAQLPRYFGRLPRQPFGIEPVPDEIAPHYTSGRYVPAPVDGTQPALYWVNTHRLESRALYALPALTLHEAVPGHHLQFALTAEDTALAPYRRWDGTLSAHTEGWALYAEFLGTEMGIYGSAVEHVGRASYEMWRACRLVVDTGLHAFGWTREQAQAYLRERTALSEHEIVNEIDRYIGWPGQAVSYKMGEIRIRALRRRLEQEQGSAFSLRGFHDRLLALGPMPLPTLEQAFPPPAPPPPAPATPAG